MEEVEVAARRRRQSRDLQGGHLDPAAENRTPEAAMRTRKESPPEMSLNSLPVSVHPDMGCSGANFIVQTSAIRRHGRLRS